MLKALNGIEFSDDEIEECFNYDGISLEELKFKSANLKTTLSKTSFEEQKREVKNLLEKDESLKAYIKGASIELLRMGLLVNGAGPLGLLKTDDIGFNYCFFVTDKRILVSDSNYYDKRLHNFKEIKLDDILDISFNKYGYRVPRKVKKASKSFIHHITLTNSFLYYFYLGGLGAAFGGFNLGYTKILNKLIANFSSFSALSSYKDSLSTGLSLLTIAIIYFIVRHFTKFKLRVTITTKDYKYYDFIIVNRDYSYIISMLKNIKKYK